MNWRALLSQEYLRANVRHAAREMRSASMQATRVFIQHADRIAADDIIRPGDREGRDRNAAGKRFKLHDAERVRQARKYEDVGRRQMCGQGAIFQQPEEPDVRETAFQLRFLRAFADDDLRAGQVERKKSFEILFDGNPSDRDEDRSREVDRDGAVRPEQIGVDPTRPHAEVAKPPPAELADEGRSGYHRDGRGGVKASQRRIDPACRYRCARRDVFGKSRCVAGREGTPEPSAIGPYHVADRSFRRDVDGIRLGLLDAAGDLPAARQGQAQAGIGRDRDGPKPIRRQEVDADTERLRAARERGQGAHHPVDLRVPGIGRDEDSHQADLGRPRSVGVLENRMRQHCDFIFQSYDVSGWSRHSRELHRSESLRRSDARSSVPCNNAVTEQWEVTAATRVLKIVRRRPAPEHDERHHGSDTRESLERSRSRDWPADRRDCRRRPVPVATRYRPG